MAERLGELAESLWPFLRRRMTLAMATGGASASSGVNEHGGLAGLGNDDHPHYLTVGRGDERYVSLAALTEHAALADVHHAQASAGDGIAVSGQQISLAATVAGAGLGYAAGVLGVGAGTLIAVGADAVGIAPGAANQFIGTGSGGVAGWRDVSDLAGSGLAAVGGAASYETIAQRGAATTAAGAGTPGGYATIALRAAASGNSYTNSLSVSRPAGVVDGDVLLAVVAWFNETLTAPSGWSQVGSTRSWTVGSDTGYARVYYRLADAEPATYSWQLSATNDIAVSIVAYDGCDASNPIEAQDSQANGSSTSMTAPTVTTTVATDQLIFLAAAASDSAGSATGTAPSGMTERADATASTWVKTYVADEALAAAGATGTRTATLSTAENNAAWLVALRPAATVEVDTSISVTAPTGLAADDVLVAAVVFAGGTLTAPSGWSQVLSQAYTGGTLRVYRKTATGAGAEPGSYTWALDTADALAVALAAYDGVDLTTPVDASGAQGNSSSTSLAAPEITTTVATDVLLFVGGVAADVRATAPSGMTEEADAGTSGVGVYLADEALAAAGATGTRTATLGSAAASAGALVALRPAVVSAGGGTLNVGVSGLGLTVSDDAIVLSSSSAPGAAAAILASDASGDLSLVRVALSDRVRTPLIDSDSGQALTVAPALDLVLNPGSGIARMGSGDVLQASSYASQTTGWRVTDEGEGDFRYLYADELHAKSFVADLEQALAGGQIIAKSVAVLAVDFVLPAAGVTGTLRVRDLPSAPNMAVFESGDFVGLRQFSRAAGSLTIGWAWGTVTSYADQSDGTQTWTFTRHATTPGAASGTIAADSLALDFGVSGGGFYEVNAVDGLYGLNAPYAQIVTWQTHPATQTVRTRLGNLRGITSVAGEYGLFAGAGTAVTDRYIRASSQAVELRNVPLALYDGANNTMLLSAGSGNNAPTFAAGSPLPTAPLTGNGIWMGLSGGSYQFRVGTVAAGALTQGLLWNGSQLTVRGTVVVTGSFSGVNYAGAASPGGAANAITGQGALATASSAAWGTQVSGRPAELTDGRITTAIAAGGIVQSRVDPGVNWGANPGAGVAGLLLGGDYMGYWSGTAWKSYMDNAGRFYLNAGIASNYLAWNGSTLTIDGTIVVRGGSGIDAFDDAGALAVADDLDDVPNGTTYARVNSTIISGGNIRVGSGTKDSTLNGWNIDATEIVGQAAGVDQVVLDTSGQIVAGQGAVRLSSTGIGVASSASTLNERNGYRLLSSDQSRVMGGIYGYMNSSTDRLEMNVYSATGRHAGVLTVVEAPSTRTADWMLMVRNDSYSYGLTVSTQFGLSLSGNTFVEGRFDASGVLGNDWSELTPATGWQNLGSGNATLGVKRFGSLIGIKGVVSANTTLASGSTIYTLASNYRPSASRVFNCRAYIGAVRTTVQVNIQADGQIRPQSAFASGEWVSIEVTYFAGG